MSDGYVPPFQVTEEITNLTIEIGQYAGFTTAFEELHPNPVLRRENRIRSIHSSLAIEQNTLTLNQVSDVIDGKRVFGPPQDIREVKNAYEVYDAVSSFDPYSVKDLLRECSAPAMSECMPELSLFTLERQQSMCQS